MMQPYRAKDLGQLKANTILISKKDRSGAFIRLRDAAFRIHGLSLQAEWKILCERSSSACLIFLFSHWQRTQRTLWRLICTHALVKHTHPRLVRTHSACVSVSVYSRQQWHAQVIFSRVFVCQALRISFAIIYGVHTAMTIHGVCVCVCELNEIEFSIEGKWTFATVRPTKKHLKSDLFWNLENKQLSL